ncbi:MAG: hypothetical protein ACKO3K_08265 [Cuspidothrix sp.]
MIYNFGLKKSLQASTISVILGTNLGIAGLDPQAFAQTAPVSSVGNGVTFSCNDTEATIKAKNRPRVTIGTTNIYIGYQQVSSVNKDPRLIRFDNGVKRWCRSDYETTNDDGTGYGLISNGKLDASGILYGVFSSTGTQTGSDFRRFATGRWLPSYGSGGGSKVAVIARISPVNGDVNYATFLSAILSSGKSNSLIVKGLAWNGTSLTVTADSWWSPRRIDKKPLTCSGSSPFKYTAVFSGDLTKVNSVSAVNCQ